jgi:integrase
MAVQRDENGRWRYRKWVRLPDGSRMRISGCPSINTRAEAEREERDHIGRVISPPPTRPEEKEVPLFGDWFNGRFWREWVVARKNKPAEVENKLCVYKNHLSRLANVRLDELAKAAAINSFRASLLERRSRSGRPLSDKSINNVLIVLGTALRYAVEVDVIPKTPKMGLFKLEQPEIDWLEFEDYQRVVDAAAVEGPFWLVAVLLAGEAGLRIGEVRAVAWQRDIDLVAGTVTVNRQRRKDVEGTPKGRTRRAIPMTPMLREGLRRLEVLRRGYVVRTQDGSPLTDVQTMKAIIRIYRRAGVARAGWHALRHSFGTHAALFGINPWRLQAWMGHKTMDMTMRYVHLAGDHARPIPTPILEAGRDQIDPDRRVLQMLGSRVRLGKLWAKETEVDRNLQRTQ